MFGLPDNNPFGLKVDTFLRLAKIPYKTEYLIDTSKAPRQQLPYIVDEREIISDSNVIINYLSKKHKVLMDAQLIEAQKKLQFLITRVLDNHLYWVISYSRWQDEQNWPSFKAEFLKQVPQLTEEDMEKAREYNIKKYFFQGIGRYERQDIYQSGIDDLKAIDALLADNNCLFGGDVHSIDACCYGFIAAIFYFDINSPLKNFIIEETSLGQYADRIRVLLHY
jgi:glutathione S-transferase